jgi:hypothetical protein
VLSDGNKRRGPSREMGECRVDLESFCHRLARLWTQMVVLQAGITVGNTMVNDQNAVAAAVIGKV